MIQNCHLEIYGNCWDVAINNKVETQSIHGNQFYITTFQVFIIGSCKKIQTLSMASFGSESLKEDSMNFFVELINNNTYGYYFLHCINRLDLKERQVMAKFHSLIYFVVSYDPYIFTIKVITFKHWNVIHYKLLGY